MKRILACLATLALSASAVGAQAQDSGSAEAGSLQSTQNSSSQSADPIGDLIAAVEQTSSQGSEQWGLKATLYHSGGAVRGRDSLGCKVSPMRTVAVDPSVVARHSIIFIKETVGMPLEGGAVHDGYWYASDIGGAIKGARIDLFTGARSSSMRPMQSLNLKTLTVTKVGDFSGCPPIDGGASIKVADAR